MELTQVASFAGIAAMLILLPGPSTLLIATTTSVIGYRAGLVTTAGFALALLTYGTLSTIGLSQYLTQSDHIVQLINFSCAIYLVFMGVKGLVDVMQNQRTVHQHGRKHMRKRQRSRHATHLPCLGRGYLTCLLNPVNLIFYLTIFPKFTDTADSLSHTAGLLIAVHILLSISWFGFIAIAFKHMASILSNTCIADRMKLFSGIAFICFGTRCALQVI
jgi:threonine/homoserine/homoserine lactone efflux protein